MTFPQMPGTRPQIYTPPVRKTPVSHCGYTALQGTPQPWTCPGCGKVCDEHVPRTAARDSPGDS
jgi:hypothetical protein